MQAAFTFRLSHHSRFATSLPEFEVPAEGDKGFAVESKKGGKVGIGYGITLLANVIIRIHEFDTMTRSEPSCASGSLLEVKSVTGRVILSLYAEIWVCSQIGELKSVK